MSERLEFKGDYMGFTYNNTHSSTLGIVRTSDGSRFNENLLPTIQDKTVQVPGGDGMYFFGSYYTQRQFSVSFAFDSLTEEQIGEIRRVFGDKQIHDLVFDERPYKTWRAKVTGTATLKYIPFDEGKIGRERVYKGEGTIQFTCYQPYAICDKKWLSDYSTWNNRDEWGAASHMKAERGAYDTVKNSNGAIGIPVFNAGDIDTHFLLKIKFDSNQKIPASKMYLNASKQLVWDEIEAQGEDISVVFNSKLNLIEGYGASNQKTGNVYNKHITSGEFFKIPSREEECTINFDGTDLEIQSIEYNYYYI